MLGSAQTAVQDLTFSEAISQGILRGMASNVALDSKPALVECASTPQSAINAGFAAAKAGRVCAENK